MAKKLDDPELRDRVCGFIRAGMGRHEACAAAGISPHTFTAYFKAHPDFREEVEEALNASVEPVIQMLRDLALEGDVTAAKEYLKHQAPPPRGESDRGKQTLDVNVHHELDAAQISSIAELEARLARRAAAIPVYEVEADDDGQAPA